MSDQLFIALDNCLKMMAQGSDLESCLVRYPELAAELRPLLLAALDAGSIAENNVPVDVLRRGKAKLLNAAAEMREQGYPKKSLGFFAKRRVVRFAFAALIVVLFMAGIGGTGLVSASSSSVPGDQLYPVKLTWENIQLKLALAQSEREVLEDRFDQERVQEINTLINSSRLENVKFYGSIEGIFPDLIIVSSVKVAITPDTKIEGDIQLKSQVRVEGRTQPDGVVLADKIKVVSSNFDEDGNPARNNSNSTPDGQGSDHGNNGSEDNKSGKTELPEINRTETPESMDKPSPAHSTPEKDKLTPETRKFEIEGNVISYNGSLIEVAGRTIFVIPETELRGSPSSGSTVYIRGYINQNGDLIALRIEVKSPSRTGGDGGQNGGGDSGGSDGHEPTRTPEPGKTPDD